MRFEDFILKSRKIREISIRCGAYPIEEEEGIIMYSVILERAVLNKGVKVLEVGSGCGYSGIWMIKAIEDSGFSNNSRLFLIEIQRQRAEFLRKSFKDYKFVEVIEGDAKEIIKELNYEIDIAFIDAAKSEYHEYLVLLNNRLKRGRILFAHNFDPYFMSKFSEILSRSYVSSRLPTSLSLLIAIKK